MRKNFEVAGFLVGCSILIAAFVIGYADWGKLANRIIIMQSLLGASVAALVFQLIMAVISKGRDRWRAIVLDSILFLGLSALTFFSIGLLFSPLALVLLFLSIFKLRKEPV